MHIHYCQTLALRLHTTTTTNTNNTCHTTQPTDPISDRLVLNHSTRLDEINFAIISPTLLCAQRIFSGQTNPNKSSLLSHQNICLITRLYLALFTIKLTLISLVALVHNLVITLSVSQQIRSFSFYCDIRLQLSDAASNVGTTSFVLKAWPTCDSMKRNTCPESGVESLVKAKSKPFAFYQLPFVWPHLLLHTTVTCSIFRRQPHIHRDIIYKPRRCRQPDPLSSQ